MQKIPLTTPEQLAEEPHSFFSVPEEQFIKVFTTAGTTGKPKKAYFTKKDLDTIITSSANGMQLMYGITPQDIVRLSFEVGYGTEIWGNRYCLDRAYGKIGAMTIATGRVSMQHELELFRTYTPTIFMDVSSRVNYLTNELSKICELQEFKLKKILTGAEPTPRAMRQHIEKQWNTDVLLGYGTTETGLLMAGECMEKDGLHLNGLNFLVEIIDPKTEEILEDGELGELIFTTYDREGMPLLRYRSHDLGRIIPDPCPCGIPFEKIEIKGRTDDMIPIGAGDNLFTRIFDEALFSIPHIVEYQAVFDRKDGKDHITIIAESDIINETIKKQVFEALMKIPDIYNGVTTSQTIAKPKIELVKPNTIDKKSIKAKRLIDNRDLYS